MYIYTYTYIHTYTYIYIYTWATFILIAVLQYSQSTAVSSLWERAGSIGSRLGPLLRSMLLGPGLTLVFSPRVQLSITVELKRAILMYFYINLSI